MGAVARGEAERRESLLRDSHDPDRPAISSGKAADRIGFSRPYVAQRIQDGKYPGYGIRGTARTRWFIYEDVVEALERGHEVPRNLRVVPAPPNSRSLVSELLHKLDQVSTELILERSAVRTTYETAEWALRECPADDDARIEVRLSRVLASVIERDRSRAKVDDLLADIRITLEVLAQSPAM
jgi:hypothetical protein